MWLWVCLGAGGCTSARACTCVRVLPARVCFYVCSHACFWGVHAWGMCARVCARVCTCGCASTRVSLCVCACVCVLAPKGARGAAGASRPGSPPRVPVSPRGAEPGVGSRTPPTHTPVTAPPATSKRPPRGEAPRPPPAAHGRASRGGTHGRWGLCPGTPPGATEPWGRVAVAVRALLLPPSAGGARSHPPVATGGLHGGSPSRVAPGHRRVTAWRRGSGDPSAWIADFGEVPLGQDPPPGPHP